jgi:hypothetical protein
MDDDTPSGGVALGATRAGDDSDEDPLADEAFDALLDDRADTRGGRA